ncbi:MAG TPA: hypothetical protein VJM12_23365 [Pyrinomonadaceae bacterium]|nr:hypothetical protein [Pyrinomonadaceae bacterium]
MPALVFFVLNFLIFQVAPPNTDTSFSELGDIGNLLLGGFVLAVAVAIAFTFMRLRLRDKKPPSAQFISIHAPDTEEEPAKQAKA